MKYIILILSIIALIIISKFLSWPLKKILKLVFNILLGLILILLVNVFGKNMGININFNYVTALIAGFLGTPGVIALIVLQFIF